ncbi:hypothetical protein [Devosia sp.]|uniref:hypothetical protein n=1 Tax=Devosia sp. TaxID=1871048 RepID=UPI002FCC3032
MDIHLARKMVSAAFESGRVLGNLLPVLKQSLPPEEYRACAHDLGVAIDATNTALLARAISAHPELETEIDAAMQQRGFY